MAIPLIRSAVSKAHYSTQKGGMYVNTTNWFLKGMAYYDRDTYKIIGQNPALPMQQAMYLLQQQRIMKDTN